MRICGEAAEGGAEGSSTCCSLDDQGDGPPYMHRKIFLCGDLGAVSGRWFDISFFVFVLLGESRAESVLIFVQCVVWL